MLISYGDYWFPWYMRRLAERPANVWFVAKKIARGVDPSSEGKAHSEMHAGVAGLEAVGDIDVDAHDRRDQETPAPADWRQTASLNR